MSNDSDPSAGEQIWSCTTGSGGVVDSNSNCYNTTIDASQIVFGLAINSAIGILCYIGFVLWRGEFRVYFNRLVSTAVPEAQRPPPLKLGGHHHLWSWLIPVFKLSDGALLESAGLDALVAQRILGFGCLALLPLTILGVGVLIPVNYTSYVPATQTSSFTDGNTTTNSTTSINDEFLRMTMSAVPFGSHVLLVHFFFTYIFIAWVCWLIVQYYKEFISLRQAHDQRLLQSTMLDKRNSLLEETAAPGSSNQIAKYLRLSLARSSCAEVDGSGRVVREVGASDRHVSVRFSDGVAAGRGSPSDLVLGGGSVRSVQATVALEDRNSTTSDAAREPSGQPRVPSPPRRPPRPPAQQVEASGASLPLPQRPEQEGVEASSHSVPKAPAAGTGGLRQHYSPKPAPEPSPFEQQASGAFPEAPHRSGSTEKRNGADEPILDLEQQGKGGSSYSAQGGATEWDELAEPLPLVQTADAAQFYTVLVVDAAVEEFTYSHVDSPWVWHMPTKIKATPRLSLDVLDGFVTKGKALARLTSVKQRQRLEHRHRRMQVAEQAYTELFGNDFDRIVPVYNTSEADDVLVQWWAQRARLDRLRLQQGRLAEQRRELEVAGEAEQALSQQVEELAQQVQLLKQKQQQRQQQEVGGSPRQGQEETAGEQQDPEQQQGEAEQQAEQKGEQQGDEQAQVEQAGSQPPPQQPGWFAGCCGGVGGGRNGTAGKPAVPAAPPSEKAIARRQKRLAALAAREDKVARQVSKTEQQLADLQSEFEEAQLVAAEAMPAAGFFATFRSAQAAAQAARLNLNPLHERLMRALPAPAPNNVNYTALRRSWMSRGTRPVVVFFFVVLMILFPIGMFAGICGTVVSSFCGSSTGAPNANWFCSDDNFASFLRNLISSTLPSILLSVWQAIVLPLWFYTCAQAEALHFSFSALDLRCATWFFLHDILNVFLGGMLGGSIVWGLRAVIEDPSEFFNILGQAAPASSNFFINYVSYRALAMATFRLFFPHAAVFGGILKWLHLVPKPKTERDKEAAGLPINCRYSRDLGVLQLTVFVVTFAYAIVAPLILPFALLYFLLTWPVWRYQMLYVYQANYDCQGQYWIYTAHRVVICLGVMSSFTSALLATKGAYAQGLVLFFTSVAFLFWFDRYLTLRYDNVVDQVPAVGFLLAPRARVDDRLYVPPPMRPRAAGWTPEWGKAWLGYGAPRYGL